MSTRAEAEVPRPEATAYPVVPFVAETVPWPDRATVTVKLRSSSSAPSEETSTSSTEYPISETLAVPSVVSKRLVAVEKVEPGAVGPKPIVGSSLTAVISTRKEPESVRAPAASAVVSPGPLLPRSVTSKLTCTCGARRELYSKYGRYHWSVFNEALMAARVPLSVKEPSAYWVALPSWSVTVTLVTSPSPRVPMPVPAKETVTSKRSVKPVTSLRSSSLMARPASETDESVSSPVNLARLVPSAATKLALVVPSKPITGASLTGAM